MSIPDFIPLGPNRVWRTYLGGRTLDTLEGKDEPADTHFPEDWIGSTTRAVNLGREEKIEEGLSHVKVDGQDLLLKHLFEQHADKILAPDHVADFGCEMGFLLKFLDSSIRLHIQCHPTIPFAQKHLNSNAGKTEAYVILSTRPEIAEPYIYFGFQRPPSKDEYRQAILNQDSDALLAPFDRLPVKPGDVFLVPGGYPHAIGEGVFMIEVMEPTDFAVRIEFERGGYVLPEAARFMGRDVDFALSMFDYTPLPETEARDRFFGKPRPFADYGDGVEVSLIDERLTDCFNVRRLTVNAAIERPTTGVYTAVVTRGEGRIGGAMDVSFADRFLVPACTDKLRIEGDLELILVSRK